MALKLTVISEQAAALGEGASCLVGNEGGSIGRAHDNDLVLPDTNRYVSAHHARIHYRNGSYLVEDTSTNGIFLNGSTDPVGKLGPQPLRPGDLLRLGNYQIRVGDEAANAADPSAIVAYSTTQSRVAATDSEHIAEDLLLEDLLLVDDASSASERGSYDAWGQKIEDDAVLSFDKAQRPSAPQRRAPAPPPASLPPPPPARSAQAPASRTPPPPPPPAAGRSGGFETFCRGAALDPALLPEEGRERMLRLAGLLLREALMGIKELARTQRTSREEAGLPLEADDPERQGLQLLPIEELMVALLADPADGNIDAVQWLRELYTAATRHETTLLRALRPALEEFTHRLDPALHADAAGAAERFRSITEGPPGRLPPLFAEALARAYESDFNPRLID